ncbi:MAG: hypothetical protein H7840_11130 [Alphaproteobacteria bacterium]
MLQLTDCVAFSGLTDPQLEAVATHKHMPMIIAAGWAENMVCCEEGCVMIEGMIEEEIACACAHGSRECAERYRAGLVEFHRDHPRGNGSIN